MACELTKEEKLALIKSHEMMEGTADVEGTMATLCEDTFHEFQPLGITVNNRETVAELYRRTLPSQKDTVASGERKDVWFSDDGALVEYVFTVDAPEGPFVSRIMVAFTFRDNLIYSERVFLNPQHAAIYAALIGEDALSLPGVALERQSANIPGKYAFQYN